MIIRREKARARLAGRTRAGASNGGRLSIRSSYMFELGAGAAHDVTARKTVVL